MGLRSASEEKGANANRTKPTSFGRFVLFGMVLRKRGEVRN